MSKKTQSWPHNTIYSTIKLLVTIEKGCIGIHHHHHHDRNCRDDDDDDDDDNN